MRGILANGVGGVPVGRDRADRRSITRFEDAWVILPIMPLVVVILLRLNGQYERERVALETDVPAAATAPILRRHVVLVFVDRLDLAAARAIQYARTLTPDELRAVHFVVDDEAGERLAAEWRRLGLARVRLELVATPDRRLTRAAVEHVAHELSDGETEVSVLLPDRKYNGLWHRILHDRTAESIQTEVSKLPHANVTTVPFHFDAWLSDETIEIVPPAARGKLTTSPKARRRPRRRARTSSRSPRSATSAGATAVRVKGTVRSMRVAPQRDVPTLECVVDDGTGTLLAVFLGRRELAGVKVGSQHRGDRHGGRAPEPARHPQPQLPAARGARPRADRGPDGPGSAGSGQTGDAERLGGRRHRALPRAEGAVGRNPISTLIASMCGFDSAL